MSKIKIIGSWLRSTRLAAMVACGLMAFGAWADAVTWDPENTKSYEVAAGDTLTISENFTLTADYTFTGSGTIIVSGGTLTLDYQTDLETNPFYTFAGSVQIDSGATINYSYPSGSGTHNDNKFTMSVLGGENATLVFNGGTLQGFTRQNNTAFPCDVMLNASTSSTLANTSSSSKDGDGNWGVNLRFRDTTAFSGSGKLTINMGGRWVEFASGISFSGFSGTIEINGSSKQEAVFYGTDYSSSSAWIFNANRDFRIAPQNNQTVVYGAITATSGNIKMGATGTTLQLGTRENGDSSINVPFTGNAFALNKVGTDTKLTLGSAVTFVSGSTLDVDEGKLELDGVDLSSNVTLDFAAGTTQSVTANGATVPAGTAFKTIEVASGGIITVPASSSWTDGNTYTLFTYTEKGAGLTFSKSNVFVSGITANQWALTTITDTGSSVTATIAKPVFTWNGTKKNWIAEGAWSYNSTAYTFCDGDDVSLTDGVSIALSSEVSPASVTISGAAAIAGSGSAKITTDTFTNNGTLSVSGEVDFNTAVTGSGTIAIAADSTASIVKAQTLTNIISGTGTLAVDGVQLTLDHTISSNQLCRLTGNLEVTNSGTVYFKAGNGEINGGDYPGQLGNSATFVFNGGTVQAVNYQNLWLYNDIVIRDGTSNTFDGGAANGYLYGDVSGNGTVTFKSGARGFQYLGDNTGFGGTATFSLSGNTALAGGFYGPDSGSADSAWNLTASTSVSRGGSERSYLIQTCTEENPLHLGSLNVTSPKAKIQLRTKNQDSASGLTGLVIGEKNEDCAIEGQFNLSTLALTKKGSASLTLGTNCTVVAGSTATVENGSLIVNAANLEAAVTVAADATLAGTGTVTSVTFSGNATLKTVGMVATTVTGDSGVTVSVAPASTLAAGDYVIKWSSAPDCTFESADGAYVFEKASDGLKVTTAYGAAIDSTQYATIAAALADAASDATITVFGQSLTPSTLIYTAEGADKSGVKLSIHGVEIAGVYDSTTGNTTWTTDSAYHWTGEGSDNNWTTPANWGLDSGYPGQSSAQVMFDASANIVIPSNISNITEINMATDVEVKLSRPSTATTNVKLQGMSKVGEESTTGDKLIIDGVNLESCGLSAGSSTSWYSDIEITGVCTNYIYCRNSDSNSNITSLNLYGNLTGDGIVYLSHSNKSDGRGGVSLYGNNESFEGVCLMHTGYPNNPRGPVTFCTATSGSGKARWIYPDGNALDSSAGVGACNLSNSTIKFGSYEGNSYILGIMKSAGSHPNNIIEIGGSNKDFSCCISALCRGNAERGHENTVVVKKGSGTMKFTDALGQPYITTWELNAGTLLFANSNIKNATFSTGYYGNTSVTPTIKFTGGTLAFDSEKYVDSNGDIIDISGIIANSTSPVTVDITAGQSVTWATALANSNTGGFTKRGEGTLTLSQVPAYTGTTRIEEGALVINGAWNTSSTVIVVDDPVRLAAAETVLLRATSFTGKKPTIELPAAYEGKYVLQKSAVTGGYVYKCVKTPGFMIKIAGTDTEVDDSELNEWLDAQDYDLTAATIATTLLTKTDDGIAPLEAYLLGYDSVAEADRVVTVETSSTGWTLTFSGLAPRTLNSTSVVTYSVNKSDDNSNWTTATTTAAIGGATLALADAGIYNKLVATVNVAAPSGE